MAEKKLSPEKQILEEIRLQQFKPVYLLMGEETFYLDMLSNAFKENVVEPESRDFDQSVLFAHEVRMLDILDYAKRYPMLSPRQLVLVYESQDLPDSEWEHLVAYLKNPQPATVLVFCYNGKLSSTSKAYKAISSVGTVYNSAKVAEWNIPSWINDYVSSRGYSITPKSAELIKIFLGNNLTKISNELAKVFVNFPAGTLLNEEIVSHYLGFSRNYNPLELTMAVAERNIKNCNRIINHFAANPKDGPLPMVVANLYGFVVKAMIYIQAAAQGDPDAPFGGKTPKYIQTASRNYSLQKLATCITYLNEADKRSKGIGSSGYTTDGELLKELIFKMIH